MYFFTGLFGGRSVLCLSIIMLTLVASVPRAQQDELASPKLRIEWSEFKKLYDSGKAVVVDVRNRESYEAGHIPGARSIPLEGIEKSAPELRKLGKPIVLYCA